MRVLLTGAGGSIGCHTLIHLLHHTDWEVVCLDSFRHKGDTGRIVTMVDGHPEYWPRVKVLTHDLTAPLGARLIAQIGKVDYVISMASLSDVHASIVDPVPFVKANVDIALNMFEYARVAKPLAFLQISTDEVYGPTDGTHLHAEWDPIVPSNPYSASKCAQEAIAISYWRTYGVPLIIVNLMNNFGEMQSSAKFPAIVQRKVRAGEEITIHGTKETPGSRVYIHSSNSADAFLYLLRHLIPNLHEDGTVDKPCRFNIVGDKQIDNVTLAVLIASTIGKPLKYRLEASSVSRPGHDLHYGLDGTKLAEFGWKSPVPFEQSMRNTVRWYEEHPEWLE